MNRIFALAVVLAGCLLPQAPPSAAYTPADPGAVSGQQREAAARTLGYPTRHTAQELDALIGRELANYQRAKPAVAASLDMPAPFTVDGVRGTCYKVVLRLQSGAAWDAGAEGGVRFDFQAPTGPGSGGPGVRGPGAVASLGCAQATGKITLTMAPLYGKDPIGHGPITLEVWRHVLTKQEQAAYEADQRQQDEDARRFEQEEAAKTQARLTKGCSKCEARYQGCLGAGRGESSCRGDYSSCAFEEAGPDYTSACPSP